MFNLRYRHLSIWTICLFLSAPTLAGDFGNRKGTRGYPDGNYAVWCRRPFYYWLNPGRLARLWKAPLNYALGGKFADVIGGKCALVDKEGTIIFDDVESLGGKRCHGGNGIQMRWADAGNRYIVDYGQCRTIYFLPERKKITLESYLTWTEKDQNTFFSARFGSNSPSRLEVIKFSLPEIEPKVVAESDIQFAWKNAGVFVTKMCPDGLRIGFEYRLGDEPTKKEPNVLGIATYDLVQGSLSSSIKNRPMAEKNTLVFSSDHGLCQQ